MEESKPGRGRPRMEASARCRGVNVSVRPVVRAALESVGGGSASRALRELADKWYEQFVRESKAV